MKKKLFALALCVIMVVAMAVPAFADGPQPRTDVNQPIYWMCESLTLNGYGLNVHGNNTIVDGNRVTLWGHQATTAQQWITQQDSWGNYRVYSMLSPARATGHALNRTSGNRCIMWPSTYSDSIQDSAADILTSSGGWQYISLVYGDSTNRLLNYTGNEKYNGQDLLFMARGSIFHSIIV